MAEKKPTTPGRSCRESIANLVGDLMLLQVSPTRYDGRDFNGMVKAREERIKELKRVNGTLDEVCVLTNWELKAFQTSKIHKLLGRLLCRFVKRLWQHIADIKFFALIYRDSQSSTPSLCGQHEQFARFRCHHILFEYKQPCSLSRPLDRSFRQNIRVWGESFSQSSSQSVVL